MTKRRRAAQTFLNASVWALSACMSWSLPAGSSGLVAITQDKGNFRWTESKHTMFAGKDGHRYLGKTQWFFHCRPRFQSVVLSQRLQGDRTQSTVRITSARMHLSLTVKTDCPPEAKVRDHERGHVEICRRIYAQGAEAAARSSCQSAIGKVFSAEGATPALSVEAAHKAAAIFVCAQYTAETAGRADDVNRAYDQITQSGRNSLSAKAAVNAAFTRVKRSVRSVKPLR